ncbi:hypothetical protein STW0522KLE44_20650 [Klebsiella sp. STW0522-44]|nr:hypothetical protein STW0522KLE44_20650 [Klebsiella sp. STW0522-44]
MNDITALMASMKAAAEKATPLQLDTAQIKRGNSGLLECPCCEGAGYVEEENDFCNIDGVALGVQFYGIGPQFGLAEEYLREATPANVKMLVEALEKAQAQSSKWLEAYHKAVSVGARYEERIAELESRTVTAPQSDYFASLVALARVSADKAMKKFPQPNYVLLKVAEEAGEVVQAGVHYAEKRMEWEQVEGEIVQLLAMLIRLVTEGDQINGITPPTDGIQVIEGEGQ